jgi:hypothetical protein
MNDRTAEHEFSCLTPVLEIYRPEFLQANGMQGEMKDVMMKELVSMLAFEAEIHLTHFFDVMRMVVKYYEKQQ